MPRMNASNLISEVAEKNNVALATAKRIFDSTVNAIRDHVHAGNEVHVHGFGLFTREDRKAKTGRDPRTGAAIEIGAKRVVKFKAAKGFTDHLNA